MQPKRIVVCLLALLLGASVLLLVVSSVEAPSSPRDVVRFSLAFEDSPVPDMASYQALVLHGAGFEYEKTGGFGYVLYKWFARAIQDNGLSMALTYRGYAQAQNRDGRGPNHDLKDMATDFVISTQIKGHEVGLHGGNFDGISLYRLIGVITKELPDGAPYPWTLPKIKGKCYSKVVWDAVYWDLVSQYGSEDEKRRVLSVEMDYDWRRRLRVNGHTPSIGFQNVDIGYRLVFRNGMGGRAFARLDVRYPQAKGLGLFANDSWVGNSFDPIIRFVFSEMMKSENRGRTIAGSFMSKRDGDEVYVDGQDNPVLCVESRERPTGQQLVDLQGAVDIPDEAYAEQWELREVKFSPDIKRIGACAFAGCWMLGYGQDGLLLPEGLESIGDGAFAGCSDIRRVEIPSTVTNLGAWAFAGCTALRHVTLPSSIREISDGLFYRGSNKCYRGGLESVAIPDTVRRIGKYAFASNMLTEIELPESVEEIDDYAFYRCESLTNVVIKGGALKRIGEAAFWGCEKLKRPELPSSVEIGEEAFGGWIP